MPDASDVSRTVDSPSDITAEERAALFLLASDRLARAAKPGDGLKPALAAMLQEIARRQEPVACRVIPFRKALFPRPAVDDDADPSDRSA